MIDTLVAAFAMFGAIVACVGLCLCVQHLWHQVGPARPVDCCPPLPPGRHFPGCPARETTS